VVRLVAGKGKSSDFVVNRCGAWIEPFGFIGAVFACSANLGFGGRLDELRETESMPVVVQIPLNSC
jgi:hypothetical protein